MTGLVLKLKPNEKVLINGVVLQNCGGASRIRVRSSDVSILRESDAMKQEDANTPLRRIYYVAQMALAGEAAAEDATDQIRKGIDQLKPIFAGDAGQELTRAAQAAGEQKYFVVMRALKKLFSLEAALLQHSPVR